MTGLIFLAAFAALIVLLIWLGGLLTRWLPISSNWKASLRVLIVVGVFPLMVVDEIIGKQQFEVLCEANGIESADVSKARGKRVILEVGEKRMIHAGIIPGAVEEWHYRDADDGAILIAHRNYHAFGGWLMRHTPLSMGWPRPMLFPVSCSIDYVARDAIFSNNNITLIN